MWVIDDTAPGWVSGLSIGHWWLNQDTGVRAWFWIWQTPPGNPILPSELSLLVYAVLAVAAVVAIAYLTRRR